MDRRSWPWKRKSSDKASATGDSTNLQSSNLGSSKVDQDDPKSVKYVQITVESYARLTELEDEVKVVNEKVKDMNEKLSSAQAEITAKENLVKQHAKVAEEAVSGWEKAETEASALKNQLESVMLMKLTAEEKVSHLDGALKECLQQVRNVKEESEQKLHDVVFAKSKQWEKVKVELESKISELEQELLRAFAENDAVSRSLQEHSNALMRVSDEKSQAEAEIDVLKAKIQACEKEISSLKYELHIASKELEIRNEEKNMCMRSSEVANKQHVEDVKKITKLEAECQRLRGLVRKKLPGPAALAQMKLEVDSLGCEYGDARIRRSPARISSPHLLSSPDYEFEQMHQTQKENDFLTSRLLAMEEETKMLKEVLSKRNSELQASRNMYAKAANKLRSIEVHMFGLNDQSSPSRPNIDIKFEGSLGHNQSNLSVTSMSEDGIDDEASCAESWATALISELSQFKKDKDISKGNGVANSNTMKLMDDFLEMERLACLSSEANVTTAAPDSTNRNTGCENGDVTSPVTQKDGNGAPDLDPPIKSDGHAASNRCSNVSQLQSRIATIFETQANNADTAKVLEEIGNLLEDTQVEARQQPEAGASSETHSLDVACEQKQCYEKIGEAPFARCSDKACNKSMDCAIDEDVKTAASQIHDVIALLGKRAFKLQSKSFEDHGLQKNFEDFSANFNKLLIGEITLGQFVMALSHILSVASEISCIVNSHKVDDWEGNASDCVDKVTLLENKVVRHETSRSTDAPEVEESINPGYELMETKPIKFSVEDFEQLKLEKENVEMDLANCTEMLEHAKVALADTEKKLEELESELTASQKSNSMVETQLKCMTESYKVLESHAKDLESEVNLLQAKTEALDNDLKEERRNYQEDLVKYKDLLLQIERTNMCLQCSTAAEDGNIKAKHELEIASAAEKLAECQETILILGRQLQSLRPPEDLINSSSKDRTLLSDGITEDENQSGFNSQEAVVSNEADHMEMDGAVSSAIQRTGGDSPSDGYTTDMSPSDIQAYPITGSSVSSNRQKHHSSRPSSSFSSPNSLTEKRGRGLSRFFSKGKSDH